MRSKAGVRIRINVSALTSWRLHIVSRKCLLLQIPMSFGRAPLNERSRTVRSEQTTTALARTASLLRHVPMRHRHLLLFPCLLLDRNTCSTLPTTRYRCVQVCDHHKWHAPCARSLATGARSFCHGWRTTATTTARVRNLLPLPQHRSSWQNNVLLCRAKTSHERVSILFDSIRLGLI